MAIIVAVSIFPLAAYAYEHHDQEWKNHHEREWREHRHDRRWREEHAKSWHDWYQWHRDNDSEMHFHLSSDEFDLDIDI